MRKTSIINFGVTIALAFSMTALTLTGCAQSAQRPSSSSANQVATTKTLTDAYGRTVEIPANVTSCATVGSAARFVVYAGGQDKLVAITELDTPASAARPYTVVWQEDFVELPTTSNGNHLMETSVNGEAMLSANPEVIISSRSAQECDALQEKLGIPVVGISYQDQIFGDKVYDSIKVVGETLDTTKHAEGVINKLKEWQSDLRNRTANIPDANRPGCYAGAVNFKGAKSFGGTFVQYPPFEAVNIKNVADEIRERGAIDVTLEQIGKWNPDFMFLNARNMDLMKKEYADNQAFFDMLTAFKDDKIYSQPSYNMNGTNIELGVCDAYFDGATVYPDAFSDVDLAKKFDEIFEVMLGGNYYEKLNATSKDGIAMSAESDFKKLSFKLS